MLLLLCTAGMVPYYKIDSNAPFSVALGQFYPWASYIVSIGACAGTFNTAFASLYAMSRLIVVLSRCRLIPEFLVSCHLLLQRLACTSPYQVSHASMMCGC
jgi:amino acid transporter